MVAAYIAELERALSPERLAPYRPAGGDDLAMVTTYFWNIALCQDLYACLGALEVSLRNGIHHALTVRYGRDDWYDISGLLLTRERNDVTMAKKEVADAAKPVTPGRVMAALRFGFWTSILDRAYGDSPKGPRFWVSPNSPDLAVAFPHAPQAYQGYRGRIHTRFNRLRKLRNRVFHYEPIWRGAVLPAEQRGQPAQLEPLPALHEQILEAIGWVSPTLEATTRYLETFDDTYQHGRQQIAARLQAHLATRP